MLEQRGITPTPIETRPIPEPWNLMFEGMSPADFFRLDEILKHHMDFMEQGCLPTLVEMVTGEINQRINEMSRIIGLDKDIVYETLTYVNAMAIASTDKNDFNERAKKAILPALYDHMGIKQPASEKLQHFTGFFMLAGHTFLDKRSELRAKRGK